jgi:tryptophan-rich sensory protein
MSKSPSSPRQALALVGFIVVTFCAPLVGIFAMPDQWYAALNKPAWNPPPWIFGPVWSLLYLMMAVAAWLVWRREGWQKALMLYFIQLTLNAAWTPIFFGAHEMGWALVEIIALWLAILLTLRSFLPISKPAAWLLAPYLAWVTFAAFLNFTLWRMNPL